MRWTFDVKHRRAAISVEGQVDALPARRTHAFFGFVNRRDVERFDLTAGREDV
jgi:hypothetical protein